MVMGPFTLTTTLLVILTALPDLPKVKPPNLVDELKVSLKVYALVKLVLLGSTTSVPGPIKLLEAKLGALFWKVRVPALMVVAPL
jgi:hypothetical protein